MNYVEAIQRDIRWLGFDWGKGFFSRQYLDALYLYAAPPIPGWQGVR